MVNASLETTNTWNTINWAKVQRKVFKLQKRIFQAVKSRQKAKARNFQKLLMKSLDLLGNKRETESLHSKDFIISYQLGSIQIEVP